LWRSTYAGGEVSDDFDAAVTGSDGENVTAIRCEFDAGENHNMGIRGRCHRFGDSVTTVVICHGNHVKAGLAAFEHEPLRIPGITALLVRRGVTVKIAKAPHWYHPELATRK
jgi:hypothetical protein